MSGLKRHVCSRSSLLRVLERSERLTCPAFLSFLKSPADLLSLCRRLVERVRTRDLLPTHGRRGIVRNSMFIRVYEGTRVHGYYPCTDLCG